MALATLDRCAVASAASQIDGCACGSGCTRKHFFAIRSQFLISGLVSVIYAEAWRRWGFCVCAELCTFLKKKRGLRKAAHLATRGDASGSCRQIQAYSAPGSPVSACRVKDLAISQNSVLAATPAQW